MVSEERGEVDLGAPVPRLLVDPIDGSLNAGADLPGTTPSRSPSGRARRSLTSKSATSTTSPTKQHWWATLGGGRIPGRAPARHAAGDRHPDGRLELLAVEAADPRLLSPALPVLTDEVRRLRVLGAIALSLCQLAAGAVDAMLTLGYCRPVDAAAGQLLVRESGGVLEWWPGEPLTVVPLDCEPRTALVAARSAASLAALRAAVEHVVPAG